MTMEMALRTDIWRWRANSDSVESPGELSRSASRTNITLVGQFNCNKYPPNQGMLDAIYNQGKPSELSWLAKHCLDECIRWLILHENRACASRVCRTCVDSSKAGLRDPRPSKRSSRNCHGPSLTPAHYRELSLSAPLRGEGSNLQSDNPTKRGLRWLGALWSTQRPAFQTSCCFERLSQNPCCFYLKSLHSQSPVLADSGHFQTEL